MKKILIFDTTLRDGEQAPGGSMNIKEKLEMAKQLEKMGVDIIEAGFPASSPGDFKAVQGISEAADKATIAALARALPADIDQAYRAIKSAGSARIHTFIATSPIHMKYKLQMTPDKIVQTAADAVKYAKKYMYDVEFTAEDATRSEPEFLARLLTEVVKAGATTINIADTVGYMMPEEYAAFIKNLRLKCGVLDGVTLSAHCHNDLGQAVANSLASIKAGVTQIECTVNGMGERAGNASLEEIVMALDTRRDYYQAETNIRTKEIFRSSQLLTRITGVKVQPNKAIVGKNAFVHEAGIHQDGVLRKKETYEIMKPESVGISVNKLVLGKHSGRHALKARLEELGYNVTEKELLNAFEAFKSIADKKKVIYDEDLEAIMARGALDVPEVYSLKGFVINSGNMITSTAVIRVTKLEPAQMAYDGENVVKPERVKEIERVATGDGPIDAAFNAVEKIVGMKMKMEDYKLNSITAGKDALGDATVKLRDFRGTVCTGRGLSTDVIEASIKAYINAVNKILYEEDE